MGADATPAFTVTSVEKDGTVVLKDNEGNAVRYVAESDLLTVKGSKDTAESTAKELSGKYEAEHQKTLQTEARVSALEEQVRQGSGSAAELKQSKTDLEALKGSSASLGNKYLELRRNMITKTYNVPKETVEKKDLAALDTFEEVLKAVLGDKKIGNFAVGGGTGGAKVMEGMSPMDLAREAYASSNRK